MTEPPHRYDATITMHRDGGHHPNPAEFAAATHRAASARAASIVSTHGQTDHPHRHGSSVGQLAAVDVALAVVSDALKRPVASSTADGTVVAG
jgi:hypothetical protein